MTETTPSPLNNVITIDDERIKSHLERVDLTGCCVYGASAWGRQVCEDSDDRAK
jgi:hypothetical protein